MDVQMPRMDGLDATRAIRAMPDVGRMPILAMTANAFGEDRDACLAAGMDDHIAKPVEPQALYAKLLRHLGEPPAGGSPAASAVPHAPGGPSLPGCLAEIAGLDTVQGVRFAGGKWPLYLRLIRMFVDRHVDDIAQLRRFLAAGEIERATRVIHTLKGVLATLGAERARDLAASLEQAISHGARPAPEIEWLCEVMEAELASLIGAIQSCPDLNSAGVAN
jgi:two-component system, sensor histidine kinase and response regulator